MRVIRSIAALMLGFAAAAPSTALDLRTVEGPPGSQQFGATVTVLANGNVVIADPLFTRADGTRNVGAVYLYRSDGTLVSVLTGDVADSYVGGFGITLLTTGNFVIASPLWSTRDAAHVGAVTFANAETGVSGVVDARNSLVGSTAGDAVGSVVPLANGHYVVASGNRAEGTAAAAGAVTWGNGRTGISGVVSRDNSLVGTSAGDGVGSDVRALPNGHYVVASPRWDDGAIADVGAVTFVDGASAVTGTIDVTRSLLGAHPGDEVGERVTVAPDGDYMVTSPHWHAAELPDVGAATFCDGSAGAHGVVGADNSLVGSHAGDTVGSNGAEVLAHGDFVVGSPAWGDGTRRNLGAATWVDGRHGRTGVVDATNSLVGSTDGDQVGLNGVTALANGNYLVHSQFWRNGDIDNAGAVTFGRGEGGVAGAVGVGNSLIGSTPYDSLTFARALTNGNYVVFCSSCDVGDVVDAGVAVFGDGAVGTIGTIRSIGADGALVGSQAHDGVGGSVTALPNGNYVVHNPDWNNGAVVRAGAVTFGDGRVGVTGAVSAGNSLVGSSAYDSVGAAITAPLANGNYVVLVPDWSNGSLRAAGAIVLGDGRKGARGTITPANALVGVHANDHLGRAAWGADPGIVTFSNGDFAVGSEHWHRDAIADVGAVTYLSGSRPFAGIVTPQNSLLGVAANDHFGQRLRALPGDRFAVFAPMMDAPGSAGGIVDAGAVVPGGARGDVTVFDAVFGGHARSGEHMVTDGNADLLVIGRPDDNQVSIVRWPVVVEDRLFGDGFDE